MSVWNRGRPVVSSRVRAGFFIDAVLLAALIVVGTEPAAGQQSAHSPHGPLPEALDCAACHTSEGWTPLRDSLAFSHGEQGFPLTGAHETADCAGCHLDLRFDELSVAPDDCASCHLDIHEGRMVDSCIECHTTVSFQDVDGDDVHFRTSFPLTGAHRQISCESCHVDDVGGAFSTLETDCLSCHGDDYAGALTIDHVASGYPTDCMECHSTLGWNDAPAFDHVAVANGFPLVGSHGELRCASCHVIPGMDPRFSPTGPEDCVSCHQADYDHEHGGSNFPTTCLSCHTQDTWDGAEFDHALAGFQLVGKHAELGCGDCHTEGQRALRFPTPASGEDCVACHQADYDDEHAGSGFPTTCLSCHNQSDWDAAGSFNHTATGFLLSGAHVETNCASCHGPPINHAQGVSDADDCALCHTVDYENEHSGSGYPLGCVLCHTSAAWSGATMDHRAFTGAYELEGPHAVVGCDACHTADGSALLFPKPIGQDDCVACHQVEYDAEHAGSGFPTECLGCHARDAWTDATVDHAGFTGGFALEGPHAVAECITCHTADGSALLFPKPTGQGDCVACHQVEYDAEHAGSGFPTDCLSCHAADVWTGAIVDHASFNGGFVLVGRHITAGCTACHATPGFTLLFPAPTGDQDCVACHQAEWDAEHGVNSYSTECAVCHTSNGWLPPTFDHDAQYFPVYSGKHREEWNDCADCHQSSPGYATFSCINCHEHNQQDSDKDHSDVADYVYESNGCYSCHPRGDS